MKSKVIVGIMLALLPISLLVLTFNFQSVKAAGSTVVSLNPLDSIVQRGDSFTINVTVTNVTDLGAWEFRLDYNTTILDAISVSPTPYTANNTDWLPIDAVGNWIPINDTLGRVWAGALIPALPGLNGSFPLVTINFTATAAGNCTLDLYKTVLGNSWAMPIAHTVIDGSVTVRVTPDTTPPTWSNADTNNTKAGQPTLFYVKWTDDVKLSGFVFGTNNTGTWVNDTWTPMSGTTDWSNVTKMLNSTPSVLVQWRVWANDASNNWNDTGILSLTTPEPPHAEFTYSPSTPYTGQNVTFNATSSYDPDGTIVSYNWDFGDTTTGNGNITTHSYAENGNYTVTLNVTDNDGLWDPFSASVTVLNRPPVASFTESAETVYTDEVISFNASASYDSDGNITSYFWDFGDGTNATGVTASRSYTALGSYTVTLTVTDDDGATGSANATKFVVANLPPVALFTENATTVLIGEVISFNASASYDPDGSIASYFWDFGDGINATGVTASHSYADDGVYPVTLTVTDNIGATDSANATKTVLNRSPVALFAENATTVLTDEVILFNASLSYDLDGSVVSYFWTFGDGANGTGVTVNHSYADNGTYTVTLTVTDDDGATDAANSTKTVLNRSPVASFTESAEIVDTGEVISFNASLSSDPDGTIVSYFWNFGDGTNATGVATVHSYADDGTYIVTLTVTDDDGATGSANATKTVLNRVPVASFTENATTVPTGEAIHFDASSSSDPDGTITSYFWDFGDETNATGVTASHSYSDNGTYTVTLTVTDDDGATGTANSTKMVLNRPPVADANGPYSGYESSPITFDASGSTDVDGAIVLYEWDWNNDGSYDESTTSPLIYHTWTNNYTGTVGLRVTDDDGLTDTITASVTVSADTTKPFIGTPSQNPAENLVELNQKVTISVEVTDDQSGVREVILYYKNSTDGGQTWTVWKYVTMSNPTGDTYVGEIPGASAGTRVQYGINALDKAGNAATNDKAGLYYVYTVVPEFPSWIAWISVIAIISLAVFLGSRKLQNRKHARAMARVNSPKTRSSRILRICSSRLFTLISSNELYGLFEN